MEELTDVRILHVDDDPGFADLIATYLEREYDRFTVETATSAADGLERLADADFDCIVSDYDMPELDGIEFLEAVRDEYPHLPFILCTGRGSEEVASDAISAGVTDYIRKGSGPTWYELLANRILNAVEQYRIRRRIRERRDQYRYLFEKAPVMFATFRVDDGVPRFERANERFYDRLGYERARLLDEPVTTVYTDAAAEAAMDAGVDQALSGDFGTERRTLVTADGERVETLNRCVPRRDEYGTVSGLLTLYVEIAD